MSIHALEDLTKYGGKVGWNSNFAGLQAWTKTQDYAGGHCYSCAGGYFPYLDTANSMIKWQSYNTYYSSGYSIAHFVQPTPDVFPGALEGTLYGYMATSYHIQSTGYNFYCTGETYAGDGAYANIRITTGLSFSVTSNGRYYGSNTMAKVYLDNVFKKA
jgi:hypothetical protein